MIFSHVKISYFLRVFKYDFSQWPKNLYNTYVYIIMPFILHLLLGIYTAMYCTWLTDAAISGVQSLNSSCLLDLIRNPKKFSLSIFSLHFCQIVERKILAVSPSLYFENLQEIKVNKIQKLQIYLILVTRNAYTSAV